MPAAFPDLFAAFDPRFAPHPSRAVPQAANDGGRSDLPPGPPGGVPPGPASTGDPDQAAGQAARLRALRERIGRLERGRAIDVAGGFDPPAVPLGVAAIDRLLPEGGLAPDALHEIEAGPGASGRAAPHDGPALAFAARLAERLAAARARRGQGGGILWIRRPQGVFDAPLYPPALPGLVDPARLLLVTARRAEDALWAMEEGLRCAGLAAVLGELRDIDMTACRRLQLAAEKHGTAALLLFAAPAARPAVARPSVCATRWRIAAAPSRPAAEGEAGGPRDLGAPRWRVELRRNRFGAAGAAEIPAWTVEWNDETRALSLAAEAVDRPSGAAQRGHGAGRPETGQPETGPHRAGRHEGGRLVG